MPDSKTLMVGDHVKWTACHHGLITTIAANGRYATFDDQHGKEHFVALIDLCPWGTEAMPAGWSPDMPGSAWPAEDEDGD